MTNLECIEYASKYSFKGLYEKGRVDAIDELFEMLEDPAYNQYLLITYQSLKDMYREYMEDIK